MSYNQIQDEEYRLKNKSLKEFRCFKCKKLLLKYENKIKIVIRCPRCRIDNYMNIEKFK